MTRDIKQNLELHRFEWAEDDALSVLEYRLDGNTFTITHTEVPQALSGRGIASDLVKHALNTARSRGWKVRIECSYAATYVKRHPEYQDLIA
ncbi:MAG TPA: GNAT family N-acetyltransferase [Pusillimonas sp.]|uniref:GNAT family N-acetyltransferase n=1 Tax=unclassified Pusillimonas TaxID=2640016 RepID=UPI002615366C|nr:MULTISPECIES: GNAT family N-acetyltransferase [unclassified Pusillimonas]HLU20167.1 GNAT family N-acetyltransferase [Pusillimonas sp.]